jgi:hypothetical protein
MKLSPIVASRRAFAVSVLAAAFLFFVAVPCALAEHPAVKQTPASCTGSVSQEQGVSVLRLWGTPWEQGHAQGKLFGRQITEVLRLLFDGPLLFADPQEYELGVRKKLLPQLEWTDAEQAEITGMLSGMRETVGDEGMVLKRLGRPIDETDLIALNTLADWIPGGCSSFAAWGDMTSGGGTIVGRNLDYFDLPGLKELHLIIARRAVGEDTSGWVSVAWPGLIGAYTAMNENGVVVAMHDVDVASPQSQVPQSQLRGRPRSLVLRRIMESTDASNAIQVAERILLASPGTRGNNFLVAVPVTQGHLSAVVFEYDGNTNASKGVTIRHPSADASGQAEAFIACTNHYRKRAKSDNACRRYRGIMDTLNAPNKSIDSDEAWKIMKGAAMKGTIHSMVAFPNTGTLELRFATPEDHACNQSLKRFSIAKLLD